MSDLLAARAQMGTSLAFHIVFAALGVGLPLLLCIAEGLALWRKDAAGSGIRPPRSRRSHSAAQKCAVTTVA